MKKKIRLGELLTQKNIITLEQLDLALEQQKRCGRKFGRILTEYKIVSEAQISEAVAEQLNIPYIDLDYYNIYPDFVGLLPESRAWHFRSVTLRKRGDTILVGMSDPVDAFACKELRRILGCNIDIAAVTETCVIEVITRNYPKPNQPYDRENLLALTGDKNGNLVLT